jgi:phosphatidylglycerophosphate synthase
MAHALTTVRLLLVVPFAVLMARGDAHPGFWAALVITVAIATDLLDGAVARRTGTASRRGGTFDHAADFLFVTGGLMAGAWRGVFPWILPVLVIVAFIQYVVDSYWLHRHSGLRASQLGRYNGILYFVPLCGDILVRLGLGFLRPLVPLVAWTLVLSTCISIGQRWIGAKQVQRRDPASPIDEAAGRSSR